LTRKLSVSCAFRRAPLRGVWMSPIFWMYRQIVLPTARSIIKTSFPDGAQHAGRKKRESWDCRIVHRTQSRDTSRALVAILQILLLPLVVAPIKSGIKWPTVSSVSSSGRTADYCISNLVWRAKKFRACYSWKLNGLPSKKIQALCVDSK
jgi:hypothetical protein